MQFLEGAPLHVIEVILAGDGRNAQLLLQRLHGLHASCDFYLHDLLQALLVPRHLLLQVFDEDADLLEGACDLLP